MEKLSLWDRLFNRYRKSVADRGTEYWQRYYPSTGIPVKESEYQRDWIEYRVVDRVTGSETIERKYLN